MHELSILAAADDAPARDCLILNDEIWSYGDIAARVRNALSSLGARGVKSGDRVAVTPRVDVDSIVWLYALFELGCPAVLLHPRLSERERGVVLAEAQSTHMITEEVTEGAVADAPSTPGPISADRTLSIAYTSGSRGTPRVHCIGGRACSKSRVASRGSVAALHAPCPRRRLVGSYSVPHREKLCGVEPRSI